MRVPEVALATAGLLLGLSAPFLSGMVLAERRSPPEERSTASEPISNQGEMGLMDYVEADGSQLVAAAGEGGSLSLLTDLLDRGADINAFGSASYECSTREDSTALMVAANRGWFDAVQLLLSRGARVDCRNKNGETALMAATVAPYPYEDGPEVVRLLLDEGADPRLLDKQGNTSLHLAARYNARFVNLLLDRGVDVNARNSYGDTPLHEAVTGADEGSLPFVRLLLKHGANPHLRNMWGRSALDIATQSGSASVLKVIAHRSKKPESSAKKGF